MSAAIESAEPAARGGLVLAHWIGAWLGLLTAVMAAWWVAPGDAFAALALRFLGLVWIVPSAVLAWVALQGRTGSVPRIAAVAFVAGAVLFGVLLMTAIPNAFRFVAALAAYVGVTRLGLRPRVSPR